MITFSVSSKSLPLLMCDEYLCQMEYRPKTRLALLSVLVLQSMMGTLGTFELVRVMMVLVGKLLVEMVDFLVPHNLQNEIMKIDKISSSPYPESVNSYLSILQQKNKCLK